MTPMDPFLDEIADRVARRMIEALGMRSDAKLQPRLLDYPQAGRYLGRSEEAVRHMVKQKLIPTKLIGGVRRIDMKDLDRLIEQAPESR